MTPRGSAGGVVRIGARTSPLAIAQADQVAAGLRALGWETAFVGITTTGDVDRRHLTQIGGTGVFAQAVREALRTGGIDVAVHSLKDLPTAPAAGLTIVATPEREDPADVLIGVHPGAITSGMRIGTGSPRRAFQLRAHLAARGVAATFVPIRGNVDRRLGLVRDGTVDATILAAAGLRRLGRWAGEDTIGGLPVTPLRLDQVVPAAGQGALALEMSDAADPDLRAAVARLDHRPTRAAITAERTFLRVLEAGCLAPIGVHARPLPQSVSADDLTLVAVAERTYPETSTQNDPTAPVRVEGKCKTSDATGAGAALANEVLTRLGARPATRAVSGRPERE